MKYNSIYTKEAIQYIIDHYGKDKTAKEIAEHIGCGRHGIKNKVADLRAAGIEISEYRNSFSVGTIRERTEDGRPVSFIKTEAGWKRIKKSQQEQKPVVKQKTINVKIKPAKTKSPTDKRKPDYTAQGQIRIKEVNLQTHYYHKVDHKTYILRPRT